MRKWAASLVGIGLIGVACLGPTQIELRITTDLAKPAAPAKPRVAIFAGAPPLPEGSGDAVAELDWSGAADLGTLTLVPKGDRSGRVAVRVAMAVNGRDPRECSDKDAAGCVIARRSLAFVPHTALSLPIQLSASCVGVPCTPDTTCNAVGQCVSAEVKCDEDGCAPPGAPPPTGDAGADAAPDAPVEAGVVDAEVDAGVALERSTLAAGAAHTCAVRGDLVRCWGANEAGQLGQETTKTVGLAPGEVASLPPIALGAPVAPRMLALGRAHSCVVFVDGKLKCWGDNASGQLGLGDRKNRGGEVGTMGAALPYVDLVLPVAQVVTGADHTCVMLVNGQVKCWGANASGQLGQGDTLERGGTVATLPKGIVPIDLGPGRIGRMITAGAAFTCAALDDLTVKCWGANTDGQLGQGSGKAAIGGGAGEMGAALPPVLLGPGVGVGRVVAGARHVCARTSTGAIKCWGANESGQLGYGDRTPRGASPSDMGVALADVKRPAGPLSTASIGGGFGCLVYQTGPTFCWGANESGQLGLGFTEAVDNVQTTPIDLGLVGVAGPGEIAAGGKHVCISVGGNVKCWGSGDVGQLGLGDGRTRGDEAGEMGPALPFVPLP